MNAKRILIVTDAWHPQINGVVTTLTKTAQTLGKMGCRVKILSPQSYKTIPCPTYPEISLSLVSPATIRKEISNFLPHAIHIATEGPLGWMARAACIRNKLAFTTSYHTRFPEYIRMRYPIPETLSYKVVRRFHNKAQKILVATEFLQQELQRRDFHNTAIWSRGVDTDMFKPKEKAFLDLPRPISVYVGRIAVEKNLPAFLDLDIPGTKLVVGDGPALASLRSKYPDAVFTGFKQGEELASYVAASDVFVFPSLTDTFGVVLLEAMACGIPAATFPVCGPVSVIKNGYNGVMNNDLKQAIHDALRLQPEHCRKFAERYSWERCTKQFFQHLAISSQPLGLSRS